MRLEFRGCSGFRCWSTFTDNINGLGGLSPSNALTSGNLGFTTNAIAGRHLMRLVTLCPCCTSTRPVRQHLRATSDYGHRCDRLANQDRILERDFAISGANSQNGGAIQTHIDQLEGAVDSHDAALPFNLSSADRGDAHLFPSANGDIVADTTEIEVDLELGSDVDSVFYSPQRSGTATITIGDFGTP